MRRYLAIQSFIALLGLAAFAASPASAAPITGSDTVATQILSTNEIGGNLGTSTTATLGQATQIFSVLAVGSNSFNLIPIGTKVNLGSSLLNFLDPSTFSFTSSEVGNFTAQSITIYGKTSTSINLFIPGLFTPGTDFPAGSTAPAGASENFGFTQTDNGQISMSGTFASTPVPEPLTIALFGAGLLALGLLRRGKSQA